MSLTPDLFSTQSSKPPSRSVPTGYQPLAHRMRPQILDEFLGQERVWAQGKPLRQWIEADRIPSMIFWGPPGSGKTTLAQLIAGKTQGGFISLSAVLSGVKEIKEAVDRARMQKEIHGRQSILFVDEIHRFNKGQQDALLPHVENGTVILIGATTENPSFELNAALLSRVRVIRFERLSDEALKGLLVRACADPERGLGDIFKLSDDALEWIVRLSEGDARRALTALETIALSGAFGILTIDQARQALESALERQPIPYDKSGEEHYSVISAFIKSMRGSDPHAALYYLARMLEGGEDPLFICRRMVIFASEDIGNADPRALQMAIAVKEAVDFIGMPEARINLGHGVTYLALAPKSNASYVGINEAIAEVRKTGALPVPMHLRNAVTGLMGNEGYGKNYQYAHDQPGARVQHAHLPEEIKTRKFYEPKDVGFEKMLKEKLDRLNQV